MEKENNKPDKYLESYLNDLYTQDEANEVFDSIDNQEKVELLDKCMEKMWDESVFLMGSLESLNKNYKYEASSLLKKNNHEYIRFPRKYLRRALSVAASIILIIIASFGGYKYITSPRAHNAQLIEISTTFGETKNISLPDGTKVMLNSCSYISFPEKFVSSQRSVKLEGEAYFQVARDEEQPFIITTDNFNVQVLGTVFNVQAYQGDEIQSVNVESGKVQVDMPDAMSQLTANEQILINTRTNDFARATVENADIALWRKGFLHFSKAPVADVVKQLERIYNYKILFENGQEFNNLISGEHENESLEEVLESIRQTTGIKWKAGNDINEIVLYK